MTLGVDPGSQRIGYVVLSFIGGVPHIVDLSVHRLTVTLTQRVGAIADDVAELLTEHPIQRVAIETPFVGGRRSNARSFRVLGECMGAVRVECSRAGIEVVEVSPAEAKRSATGNGNATKEQVARAVAARFGLDAEKIVGEAADAIAVGLAGGAK